MPYMYPVHTVRLKVPVDDSSVDEVLRRAADMLDIIGAYFTLGDDGKPAEAPDGTYEVHAPQLDRAADIEPAMSAARLFIVRSRMAVATSEVD